MRFQTASLALFPFMLLTGCLAPSIHSWQTPPAEMSQAAWNWKLLPTNQYSHVLSNQVAVAVACLIKTPFIPLEASDVRRFLGDFSAPANREMKPYLVRGVHFGYYSFTELRHDPTSRGLLSAHATYDGEILVPFARNVQEPTAIVVFLDQPPSSLYVTAYSGGDRIWRGKDTTTMDRRK